MAVALVAGCGPEAPKGEAEAALAKDALRQSRQARDAKNMVQLSRARISLVNAATALKKVNTPEAKNLLVKVDKELLAVDQALRDPQSVRATMEDAKDLPDEARKAGERLMTEGAKLKSDAERAAKETRETVERIQTTADEAKALMDRLPLPKEAPAKQ